MHATSSSTAASTRPTISTSRAILHRRTPPCVPSWSVATFRSTAACWLATVSSRACPPPSQAASARSPPAMSHPRATAMATASPAITGQVITRAAAPLRLSSRRQCPNCGHDWLGRVSSPADEYDPCCGSPQTHMQHRSTHEILGNGGTVIF